MNEIMTSVTTLFLDIGGVLLTNGWDHTMRQKAAEKIGLDYEEMNEHHHLTFGKLKPEIPACRCLRLRLGSRFWRLG